MPETPASWVQSAAILAVVCLGAVILILVMAMLLRRKGQAEGTASIGAAGAGSVVRGSQAAGGQRTSGPLIAGTLPDGLDQCPRG